MDHVLRYQDTPGVKMIVVLGEVSYLKNKNKNKKLKNFSDKFFLWISVFKKCMHFGYI